MVAGAVSLKDFNPPTATKTGSSRAAKKSPTATFGDDVERIKARTEAIIAETNALAGLNPLIDDNEFAVTKAKAAQDLLNEAKKAGLAITPELSATIDALSSELAKATAGANSFADSQQKIVERAQEFNALGKDVMGGFISDLRQGKSAADALNNSLNKIADRLLDMALNSLFATLPGGSGYTGAPIKLAGARASGGPVSAGKPYLVGERGKEIVVPGQSGMVIPNNKIGAGGGSKQVVNIYNNSGSEVSKQSRNEGGVDVLDIFVGEVGKAIGNGKLDGSMSRFGAKPQARRFG